MVICEISYFVVGAGIGGILNIILIFAKGLWWFLIAEYILSLLGFYILSYFPMVGFIMKPLFKIYLYVGTFALLLGLLCQTKILDI